MTRLLAVGAAVLMLSMPATGQTTYTGGVLLPGGDLGSMSKAGFGFAVRNSGGITSWLGFRADAGVDYFNTTGDLKNHLFSSVIANLTFGMNDRVYEFVGFGIYLDTQSRNAQSDSVKFNGTLQRTLYTFGAQAGIGIKLDWPPNTFIEVGTTKLFTRGQAFSWIPIRFGVAF